MEVLIPSGPPHLTLCRVKGGGQGFAQLVQPCRAIVPLADQFTIAVLRDLHKVIVLVVEEGSLVAVGQNGRQGVIPLRIAPVDILPRNVVAPLGDAVRCF